VHAMVSGNHRMRVLGKDQDDIAEDALPRLSKTLSTSTTLSVLALLPAL
jgi:hypothetical protein